MSDENYLRKHRDDVNSDILLVAFPLMITYSENDVGQYSTETVKLFIFNNFFLSGCCDRSIHRTAAVVSSN
jgi:hypothetical protein